MLDIARLSKSQPLDVAHYAARTGAELQGVISAAEQSRAFVDAMKHNPLREFLEEQERARALFAGSTIERLAKDIQWAKSPAARFMEQESEMDRVKKALSWNGEALAKSMRDVLGEDNATRELLKDLGRDHAFGSHALREAVEAAERAREHFKDPTLFDIKERQLDFEPPILPAIRNPMEDTNKKLDDVLKESAGINAGVRELGKAVSNLVDAQARAQLENTKTNLESLRTARLALWVALFSAVVALAQWFQMLQL